MKPSNNILKSACKNVIILCLLHLIVCQANQPQTGAQALGGNVNRWNDAEENRAYNQCVEQKKGNSGACSCGNYDQLNSKFLQLLGNFNRLNRILTQKNAELSQRLNEQNKQISALTHALNAQAERLNNLEKSGDSVLGKTIQHLRVNGLRLGNRWVIRQQGTGSYEALVFRDLTSTNSGQDRRYAMYKGKYTDL